MDALFDKLNEVVLEWAQNLITFGYGVFNDFANHAMQLLAMSPESWSPSGWSLITSLNTIFVVVAAQLVVVFFLIGFCAESLDPKQELRFETILRMFIKLSVAEFFVVNTLPIVQSFFSLVGALAGSVAGEADILTGIPDDVRQIMENPDDMGGMTFVAFLLGVVFMLIMMISGVLIVYQAYIRFFKIMLLIPYGTLANSTLAGNHTLVQSAVSFWKFALSSILEAVTMMIALRLAAMILTSAEGTVNFLTASNNGEYLCIWMIQSAMIVLVCVGSVKGASMITQRALGL